MAQHSQGQKRGENTCAPRHIYTSGLAAGCSVLTLDGELPVEFLHAGDRIVTVDQGKVRLRAISARPVWKSDLVRINPRALAPTTNAPDIWIAAHQPLLIRDWRAKVMFGRTRALVPANRMLDGEHIRRERDEVQTTLFQLHFDETHLLRVAGIDMTSTRLPGLKRANQRKTRETTKG
ncbi:Hint domain-containing protein [Aliiroseovarius subalbicans]|uniref:Hint domain-containing protein n=1 Tax=Aliiroseovarius subalbicans TaxID=2925840 RepID=UPI001F57989D|nr:Hint domain-containing protein [Aliiroseovarius subalbicans]MCI2398656.1 Hint domain-containing protein [Aliiroseovarius subalbicans]